MEPTFDDIVTGAVLIGGCIVFIAGLFGVFQKVGMPPWLAFIPLANLVGLCQAARVNPAWLLAIFVPGLNLAFAVYLGVRLADRFGLPSLFGAIMGATGFVLLPVIGFGGSRCSDELALTESIFEATLAGKDREGSELKCDLRHARSPAAASRPKQMSGLSQVTKAWLIAASVLYCGALLLSPGLLVIGAMAFDSGAPSGDEVGLWIVIGSVLLVPVTMVCAVSGSWFLYWFRYHRSALCVAALPVVNVAGFFVGVFIACL